MDNYDVKKERRELYSAKQSFTVLEVPEMRFLAADGKGDPNTSDDYTAVVEALYSTSYAIRAAAKEKLGRVHTVGPLEGLWSAKDMRAFQDDGREDAWEWTLMIAQPDWIDDALLTEAQATMKNKGKSPTAGDRVHLKDFEEGLSVQILYIGPYDQEAETIAKMHEEFLPKEGLAPRGRHHEIYLSDARRTDPSKLRTILRQSVRRI